jgi:Response receiver domain
MADAGYEAVVKETFETKPLRTVLMIDDEFPTFSDLALGETEQTKKRFAQKDRAVALYNAFQKRHMICDVENVANDVRTDRLRKSDLVILDYHLGPGHNESDRAIEILRDLSGSKHFNTVVVYTGEPDLNKVWLDIVAGISGGWTAASTELKGGAQQHWERLSDEGKLPDATVDAMMAYGKRRNMRSLPPEVRKTAQDELVALGVPPAQCGEIIEALIHKAMAGRSGRYATEPHRPAVGNYEGDKRWIQSGSVFIAIMKKGDLNQNESDPAGIMAGLSDALLAWRPNLIQILISEIQNILELEALATEDDHLKDPVTHTAFWYYLLDALGPIDPAAAPNVKVALMALVDKLVDGVRRRLASDPSLLDLASRALLGELKDTAWTQDTWPKAGTKAMLDGSVELARTQDLTTHSKTMLRLNAFLSTEQFRRAHLTTGTIFHHAPSKQYFVAASPACDLVSRKPSPDQWWAHSIFPFTPLVAILLTSVGIDAALNEAAHGVHVFFESGPDSKAFKLVAGPGHQPPYEFFIVKNEGRVRENGGKTVFDAARLMPKEVNTGGAVEKSATEREWVDGEFEVVAQLRGVNATHVLQLAGQHLSRIGLDFISMIRN